MLACTDAHPASKEAVNKLRVWAADFKTLAALGTIQGLEGFTRLGWRVQKLGATKQRRLSFAKGAISASMLARKIKASARTTWSSS